MSAGRELGDRARLNTGALSDGSELGLTEQTRPPEGSEADESFQEAKLLPVGASSASVHA